MDVIYISVQSGCSYIYCTPKTINRGLFALLKKSALVPGGGAGNTRFLFLFCRTQPYEEVSDLEQLQSRMVQSLGDYNARSRKPMDLVMFMFAVEHVNRLAR